MASSKKDRVNYWRNFFFDDFSAELTASFEESAEQIRKFEKIENEQKHAKYVIYGEKGTAKAYFHNIKVSGQQEIYTTNLEQAYAAIEKAQEELESLSTEFYLSEPEKFLVWFKKRLPSINNLASPFTKHDWLRDGYNKPVIVRPPANQLHEILAWLLPEKVYKNTIEQMKGDFREDYYSLLEESDNKITLRLRWLTLLHTLNCLSCVSRVAAGKLFKIPGIFKGAGK